MQRNLVLTLFDKFMKHIFGVYVRVSVHMYVDQDKRFVCLCDPPF